MAEVWTKTVDKDGRVLKITKETSPSNINVYLGNNSPQTDIQKAIYVKLGEMNVNQLLTLQCILAKLDANQMQLYDLLSILNNKIDSNTTSLSNKIDGLGERMRLLEGRTSAPQCSRCPACVLYSGLVHNRCM